MDFCPYPGCWANHALILGLPYERWYSARCWHNREPCCEWCQTWKDLHGMLFDAMDGDGWALPHIHPGLVDCLEIIGGVYDSIHYTYADWSESEPDFYELSFHVDKLSVTLWRLCKIVRDSHLRRLAEELGTMAKELQVAPKRELYYTMPRLRYLPSP